MIITDSMGRCHIEVQKRKSKYAVRAPYLLYEMSPSSTTSSTPSWLVPLLGGCAAGIVGGAAAFLALSRRKPPMIPSSSSMAKIKRWGVTPRAAAAVSHNGVIYLSGQVGIIDALETSDVQEQTRQTLAKIDRLLAEAGSSKRSILST